MQKGDQVKFKEHDNTRIGIITNAFPESDKYYVQPEDWPEADHIHGPFSSLELEPLQ